MTEPFIEDPAEIAKLTRGQLISYVQHGLLRHAAISREAAEHDFMCAAALALDRVLAKGKDQVQRGVKVDPLIESMVDALRSSLIAEITARSAASPAPEPKAEEGHADAA